jgi:hypothetical protein
VRFGVLLVEGLTAGVLRTESFDACLDLFFFLCFFSAGAIIIIWLFKRLRLALIFSQKL